MLDTRPLSDCLDTELKALLNEECRHWAHELDWDFSEVANAVLGGLARGALTGRVARVGSRLAAYCYCLPDEGRVVVGSLFGTQSERGKGLEEALLERVLADAEAQANPGRVECQTLFSTASEADRLFVRRGFAGCARLYMTRTLGDKPASPEGPWRLRAVTRADFGALGQLVHTSHAGSLDGILNLTYSSPAACRHFVETLVVRAGCGPLDVRASRVAEVDGRIVGAVLASRLSRTNGHICQVSVTPEWQTRGLGTALLAWALDALFQQGLATTSLSVTLANRPALRLYERFGFRTLRTFGAHAWVRPPARIQLPA